MASSHVDPMHRSLRLRWPLVLALVGSLAAVVLTREQPAIYRAECVVDYGREPTEAVAGSADQQAMNQEWYRTQDVILSGTAIAREAVETLGLDRDPSFTKLAPSARPEQRRAAAVGMLRHTIAHPETSRLARLSVEDEKPERAARIANALAEAYLRRSSEARLNSARQAYGWLREQVERTTQRLSENEGEIERYFARRERPAIAYEAEQALVSEEIQTLTRQLTEARFRRIELAAHAAKLKSAAQQEDPFAVYALEFNENAQIKELRAAFMKLSLKQMEMETASAESDQSTQLGKTRLAAVREQMRRTLDGIFQSAQSEVASVQQVEAQLNAALARANAHGRELQRDQHEYGRLARDRSETEALLNTLRERASAASLASAAGASGTSIVEYAEPSLFANPRPFERNAAIGAALGAMLGLLCSALLAWRR